MTVPRLFSFLLACLFLLTIVPISISASEMTWWDTSWSFRQEIPIPFDTSKDNAKFQPLDLSVRFESPCWAKNEQEHSIRVVYQDGETLTELESQIYDLNFSDVTHIKTCNVVFIIPEQATGNEHYFIYYNDKETPAPHYPDHLQIEEAHYYFAPIPGYPFESEYYKITEDGYIIYGIAYEGKFLGISTAQQVTLFKEHTTAVTTPKDVLAFASFDYFYYYGKNIADFASTIQQLVSKKIVTDGNLMVSCQIISETSREDFRTTATYKYYYCPDPENRRISAHVIHEALKASQVIDFAPNSESSGNIASFQVGEMKSPSITDLNFGQMFPYLDVSAQDNRTVNYPQDMNPEYTPEGITIINTQDNIDLGKKAWVCFDEGTTGLSHALIFGSPSILVSGTDERDGIQIKAVEGAGPGLLGLRSTAQTFYCSRNSYEKGTSNDLTIPADFVVEFDAEFYTSNNGGYPAVDNESMVFQKLVRTRPSLQGHTTEKEQQQDTYTLTAFVHLAPSTPMGTVLSLLTGKNFSYISAELYRANDLISSDIAGRLSISSFPSFTGTKLLKKIFTAISIFDLKNFTVFKKIRFDNLPPGTYLVKVYKEHPLLGHERKYIGYKIVEVKKNTATHIFCRPEAHLNVVVNDQQGTQVNDVDVRLLSGDIVVAEKQSTSDATTILSAPCIVRGTYQAQFLYKGFLIYDKPVSLRLINSILLRKISVDIALYDLNIDLKDLWGVHPSETLYPTLTSSEMKEPHLLTAQPMGNGQYLFEDLCPATYHLQVSYQSFLLQENITISSSNEKAITLVIPTEFNVTLTTYDSRGMQLPEATVTLEREGKTRILNQNKDGRFSTQLPPGIYTATVFHDDTVIGKRTLTILSERSFDLLTTEEPGFPLIVIGAAISLFALGALLLLRKKDVHSIVNILALTIMVISLVFPWWTIQGSSTEPVVSTVTHLYFIPSNLISFTTTATVIAGERASASVPTLFTLVINLLLLAVLASGICIIIHIIAHRFQRKKFSKVFLILGIVFLILTLVSFSLFMSVITKVGVGGVFGQRVILTNVPGENIQIPVSSSWGLDTGFYLCCIAVALLIISSFLRRNQLKTKRTKTR